MAVAAFAVAGCLQVFHFLEDHVEETTLAAVHRRKTEWQAGLSNLFGSGFCRKLELADAEGFEVATVKADEIVLARIEAENLRDDGFKGAQEFTVVLGDERCIGARKFNVYLAGFKAIGIACAFTGCDAVFEAQSAQLVDGA